MSKIRARGHSRSLKVVPFDRLGMISYSTYRSANYDFLLTFHDNYGPIFYRFRDRRRFQSKIANFSHTVYFAPQPEGFPLEFSIGVWGQKTRIMGLPGREICLTISSAVWIQCTNVMDKRIPNDSKDRAITHSVAR